MAGYCRQSVDQTRLGPIMAVKVGPPLDSRTLETARRLGFSSHRILSALIDTGAPRSGIRHEIMREMGLTQSVSMILLDNPVIKSLPVTAMPTMQPGVDCIIGRDILKRGKFFYNGDDDEFTLMITGE